MEKIENKKSIILILIVAMLILIILLISSIQRRKKIEINNNQVIDMEIEVWEEQELEIPKEAIEEAAKDLLIIENMNEIRAVYKDEKRIGFVSYKIEDTIKNIFNGAVKSNNLESFYNKNIAKITETTYIESFVKFEEFINKIFEDRISKIIKVRIKPGSVNLKDSAIVSTMELTLENNNIILLTLEVNEFTYEIKIY